MNDLRLFILTRSYTFINFNMIKQKAGTDMLFGITNYAKKDSKNVLFFKISPLSSSCSLCHITSYYFDAINIYTHVTAKKWTHYV